jgi:transposase
LPQVLAGLPPCLIAMEACGGAHYWGRRCQEWGHRVKLLAPRYVKAFCRGAKNDRNDARAICEAARQPGMPGVGVKSEEQQHWQALHRVRALTQKQRTMVSNQLRGLLAEHGVVFERGEGALRRALPTRLERLAPLLREVLQGQYELLVTLDRHLAALERQVRELARASAPCGELMRERGVGPLIATAVVAEVADAQVFHNGRQFAASLGLVPRQHSTGGRPRLLGISKRGDHYLRTLLVHGARAALRTAEGHDDPISRWARGVAERRGANRAAVALANKLARRLWARLRYGTFAERLTAGVGATA